jgi:5-formyltetrahydrofolate cyclo-ligase
MECSPQDISTRKNILREQIWVEVDKFVGGPKPVKGRIPNFKGSKSAANNLMRTEEFQNAKVIKVHPSLNAISLREEVLRSGKTLLVPPLPGHDFLYFLVNPESIKNERFNWAAQKRGFNRIGLPLNLKDVPKIDLFVVAATVVSYEGCRAGKGKGYGEVEWGIASELGVVDSSTTVATIVHDVQLVDSDRFPSELMEAHDLPVDIIATPTQVIKCNKNLNESDVGQKNENSPKRSLTKPKGIIWEKIDNNMIRDIGALKYLKEQLAINT